MNLILSDRHVALPPLELTDVRVIDLSTRKISNCVGCFGCWTKTPGKCVIRDDAVQIYPLIAESRRVLYISKLKYGGYDTPMKTMLERAIPIQQAFIRLLHGETHHVQRRVVPKQATILAYGEIPPQEQAIFRQLVARNAHNMNFETYQVLFVPEQDIEKAVQKEVLSWENS